MKTCIRTSLVVTAFALFFTTACSFLDISSKNADQVIPYAQNVIAIRNTTKDSTILWEKNKHKFKPATIATVNAALDRLNKLISVNHINVKQKVISIASANQAMDQVLEAVAAIEKDGAELDEEEVDILVRIKKTVSEYRINMNKLTVHSLNVLQKTL